MCKGLHAPGIVGLNIHITCIVKYIDAGGASCPGIGEINISVSLL
jgi:hypothetical protein